MKVRRAVAFDLDVDLTPARARTFVQDPLVSLARLELLEELTVEEAADAGGGVVVHAVLPVNAAMFGQRRLAFRSRLVPTCWGALLESLPLDDPAPGWAEVAGEARVTPAPAARGSRIHYDLTVTVHLDLPEPERWGGRALTRMVAYTADRMLERITSRFPSAVGEAAELVEAAAARA